MEKFCTFLNGKCKENENSLSVGLWNFFARLNVERTEHRISIDHNSRWSFEWKRGSEAPDPLLHNDIYGILQDAGFS